MERSYWPHELSLQCMPHLPASIACGHPFLPSGAGSPSIPTVAPLPCTQTVTLRRALPLDIKGAMSVGKSLPQARMAHLEAQPAVCLPTPFAALLHVSGGHPVHWLTYMPICSPIPRSNAYSPGGQLVHPRECGHRGLGD